MVPDDGSDDWIHVLSIVAEARGTPVSKAYTEQQGWRDSLAATLEGVGDVLHVAAAFARQFPCFLQVLLSTTAVSRMMPSIAC